MWSLLATSATAVICVLLGAWLTRKQGENIFVMQKRSDVFYDFMMKMNEAFRKVSTDCDAFREEGCHDGWKYRMEAMIIHILWPVGDHAEAVSMYITNANRDKFMTCFRTVRNAVEKIEIEHACSAFRCDAIADGINYKRIKREELKNLKDLLIHEIWISNWPEKSFGDELQCVSWMKTKLRQIAQRIAQRGAQK